MCNRKISPSSLPAWWLDQHERIWQVYLGNRAAFCHSNGEFNGYSWGLRFGQCKFHAGVQRPVRNVSTVDVWKHLRNEMQINGSNMLRLHIWTQMRKCKRTFCIATLTSHVLITTNHDILMCRMWGIVMPHNYYSLGEILHFTTIVRESFAFLTHSDVGNDSVIYLQYNHNLPYFGSVQALSLFSSLVGFMGISKCYRHWAVSPSWRWQVKANASLVLLLESLTYCCLPSYFRFEACPGHFGR